MRVCPLKHWRLALFPREIQHWSRWYVPLCGLRATTNVHLITRPEAVRDYAVVILLPRPLDLCGEQEKHEHSVRCLHHQQCHGAVCWVSAQSHLRLGRPWCADRGDTTENNTE